MSAPCLTYSPLLPLGHRSVFVGGAVCCRVQESPQQLAHQRTHLDVRLSVRMNAMANRISKKSSKMASLHPAEEATLRTFVVSAKRDRWLALFGSPKRRKQARDALNHFADWDARYA